MPLKCDICNKEAVMFYIVVTDSKSSVMCCECNKKKENDEKGMYKKILREE